MCVWPTDAWFMIGKLLKEELEEVVYGWNFDLSAWNEKKNKKNRQPFHLDLAEAPQEAAVAFFHLPQAP